jgi:transposase
MKRRFIKPLSSEEQVTLEEGYRNSSKFHFRNRCKSILLSTEGYTVSEISSLFNVRTRTIYTWFSWWEESGIVGLMISPGRGVKATLDVTNDEHQKIVTDEVAKNPQSLKEVAIEVSQILDIKVTKNMLHSFLKKKDIAGNV